MYNVLVAFLIPTLFFGMTAWASLQNNNILRVGGVVVGLTGFFASVINLVIQIIICVN
jgi:hypothetical protein